jgi:hypothetical protein
MTPRPGLSDLGHVHTMLPVSPAAAIANPGVLCKISMVVFCRPLPDPGHLDQMLASDISSLPHSGICMRCQAIPESE